jgi:crotonobetainyl-CoA:carnitine CoA-transferase CaiB-like acyl-CoA transferase
MGHTLLGDDVQAGPLLYQIYRLQPTADGHLVYFAASDAEAHGLFRALRLEHLIDDSRFATMAARQTPDNFAALGELLNDAFLAFQTDDIMHRLHREQVPAAPILSLDEVFADEQVLMNDAIHTWEHPVIGPVRQARPPVRWSHTIPETVWAVDRLGESSDTIAAELGYAAAQIETLRKDGVLGPL